MLLLTFYYFVFWIFNELTRSIPAYKNQNTHMKIQL